MANFDELKQEIRENIRPNGIQAITGAVHQATLLDVVDTLGRAINNNEQAASDANIAAGNAQHAADTAQGAAEHAQQTADGKYTKPAGGIPRTDLAQEVTDELDTLGGKVSDLEDEVEDLEANKANKVGIFPGLMAGTAGSVLGPSAPFEFSILRYTGASGIAKVAEVRGKSVVWNQFLKEINTTNYSQVYCSISNGEITVNGRPTPNYYDNFSGIQQNTNEIIAGHKYYFSLYVSAYSVTGANAVRLFVGAAANQIGATVTVNGVGRFSNITTAAADRKLLILGYVNTPITEKLNEDDTFTIKDINLIDLTLLYGAGNEPATVAEFEALYGTGYKPYDPGSILSNKTQALEVVGFNQWDEVWESGVYNTTTGAKMSGNGFRNTNPIPAFPSTTYGVAMSSGYIVLLCYDADGRLISNIGAKSNGQTFTTPANTRFICFYTLNQSSLTYQNDICINLSNPAKNGTYEPYKRGTVTLNLTSITGKLNGEGESVTIWPNGSRSAGSVYDALIVDEDGWARRARVKMASVDLGTPNWVYTAVSQSYPYGLLQADIPDRANGYYNIICERYIIKASFTTDKVALGQNSGSKVYIVDSAYSDAATFKTAMNGVELVYERTTPLEYVLDTPIYLGFQVFAGGTITQTPQAPDSAPMVMAAAFPEEVVGMDIITAILDAQKAAGIFTDYTITYDPVTGKPSFAFTA